MPENAFLIDEKIVCAVFPNAFNSPVCSSIWKSKNFLPDKDIAAPATVATVGINNSYNAGMLAVQMLSIGDESLKDKLIKYRKEMKRKFIDENGEGVDL